MHNTNKSELPKLSDGDEELDYHLGNYPVVLADEDGVEIEVKLCAIVEIDDLIQIFRKYGKGDRLMREKIITQELIEMSALIDDDGLGSFREFNINDLVRYIQVQREIDLVEMLDEVGKQLEGHSRQETIDWIDNRVSQYLHEKPVKREYNGFLKSDE